VVTGGRDGMANMGDLQDLVTEVVVFGVAQQNWP
jgi:hypothetical protein